MTETEVLRLAAVHMIQELIELDFCPGRNCKGEKDMTCVECCRQYFMGVSGYELEVSERRWISIDQVLAQMEERDG